MLSVIWLYTWAEKKIIFSSHVQYIPLTLRQKNLEKIAYYTVVALERVTNENTNTDIR